MKSRSVRQFLLRVLLGPAMMFGIMGVDGGEGGGGEAGGDAGAGGGEAGGAAPADGGAGSGGDPAAGGAAPEDAEAASAAEAARRAALSDEERAAEDAAAEAAKGKEGAPETYADFTAPEGVTLDKEAIAAALPMFKEMNLTQEQAQRLVTLQAENVQKANEAFAADKATRLQAIKDGKEFGGDKFEATSEAVGRALNTMLNQDEQVALKAYTDRFGPCPELFTLMARVATRMKEDTGFETGGQEGTKTVNFYNNSNMK
jgi:hypothetical protein